MGKRQRHGCWAPRIAPNRHQAHRAPQSKCERRSRHQAALSHPRLPNQGALELAESFFPIHQACIQLVLKHLHGRRAGVGGRAAWGGEAPRRGRFGPSQGCTHPQLGPIPILASVQVLHDLVQLQVLRVGGPRGTGIGRGTCGVGGGGPWAPEHGGAQATGRPQAPLPFSNREPRCPLSRTPAPNQDARPTLLEGVKPEGQAPR